MQPRDEKGRVVSVNCPDPNCGGRLVHEISPARYGSPAQHQWYCDGLMHDREYGDLVACPRMVFGPFVRSEAA